MSYIKWSFRRCFQPIYSICVAHAGINPTICAQNTAPTNWAIGSICWLVGSRASGVEAQERGGVGLVGDTTALPETGGCRSANSGSHKWQLSQWTCWCDPNWQEGQTRQPVCVCGCGRLAVCVWRRADCMVGSWRLCVCTLADGWVTGFPLTDVSHNRALSMKWVVKSIGLRWFPSMYCVGEAFSVRQQHLTRKKCVIVQYLDVFI